MGWIYNQRTIGARAPAVTQGTRYIATRRPIRAGSPPPARRDRAVGPYGSYPASGVQHADIPSVHSPMAWTQSSRMTVERPGAWRAISAEIHSRPSQNCGYTAWAWEDRRDLYGRLGLVAAPALAADPRRLEFHRWVFANGGYVDDRSADRGG